MNGIRLMPMRNRCTALLSSYTIGKLKITIWLFNHLTKIRQTIYVNNETMQSPLDALKRHKAII